MSGGGVTFSGTGRVAPTAPSNVPRPVRDDESRRQRKDGKQPERGRPRTPRKDPHHHIDEYV